MTKLLFIDSYLDESPQLRFSELTAFGLSHPEFTFSQLTKYFPLSDFKVKITSSELISNKLDRDYSLIWPLNLFCKDFSFFKEILFKQKYSAFDIFLHEDSREDLVSPLNCIQIRPSFLLELDSRPIFISSSDLNFIRSSFHYSLLRSKKPLSRSFNQLTSTGDWYSKSSRDKTKLLNEFNYILELPPSLKTFYPSIDSDSFTESKSTCSYRIQKINGSDMANLLISDSITSSIARDFSLFINNWIDSVNSSVFYDSDYSFSDFLIEKNKQRFDLIVRNSDFYQFLCYSSQVYNLPSPSLLFQNLQEYFSANSKKIDSYKSGAFHGDLCLSNIIYSSLNNSFYLIDPRGKSGGHFTCNILYELAKLRHSIVTGYDFINTSNYKVNFSPSSVDIDIPKNTSTSFLNELFSDVLKRYEVDPYLCQNIEASLFLSMIPLHIDNPQKCLTFYIVSSKLINV